MRGLIAFALSMVAASGAYAACPGTLTDCPSPSFNNLTVGGTITAPTGVTQGEYGDATHVPQITIGPDGRVTSAAPVAITGTGGGGGAPSGPASGDLNGSYPGPTVAGLQGKPVATTAPITNQVLLWNGTNWAPAALLFASGDLSGSYPSPTVVAIQGKPVVSTPPASGQVLQFNGTSYVPTTPSSGGGPPSGNAQGDLSGSYPGPTVAKIQGQPVASSPAPSSGQFLSWNGSAWTAVPAPTGTAANPGGSPNQVQVNLAGAFGGIPFGNTGQVLVSNGSSTAPSFVDPVVSAIAGGFADGAITTQGSKADAPNCATGNTEIACLRQLDADVKGSIPAGSAIIGGINNFPVTVDTNAGAPTVNTIRTVPATGATTATYAGTLTLTALDVSTVTTGGTAVTALTAGHRAKGGWIKNPDAATAALCINEIGTASGTTTSGSTICIAAGQSYQLAPSGNTVSVVTSDANHSFGGYGFQ